MLGFLCCGKFYPFGDFFIKNNHFTQERFITFANVMFQNSDKIGIYGDLGIKEKESWLRDRDILKHVCVSLLIHPTVRR